MRPIRRSGATRGVAGATALSAGLLSTVLLASVLLGPLAASAQAAPQQGEAELPVTWGVKPAPVAGEPQRPNFDLEAAPGESISDALIVENLSTVDLVLGVYASDAYNTPDGGIDLLASSDEPVDLGSWVSVETPSIRVPAGGSMTVPFTINVPSDASPGDHVGGIVTSLTLPAPDAEGHRVEVERRLGSRIYMRVDGELNPQLRFTSLTVDHQPNANPFAPGAVEVTYDVENVGNVRLRATRELRVTGGLGTGTRSAEAADMAELLPGNSYRLTQRIDGIWPTFSTTIEVVLQPYEPSGAQLEPAPGPVTARTTRMFVPVSQLLLIGVLVIGTLVILWQRRRNRRALTATVDAAVAEALRTRDGKPNQ